MREIGFAGILNILIFDQLHKNMEEKAKFEADKSYRSFSGSLG